MRCGKCLVQVEMAQVKTGVTSTRDTQDAVGIGLVVYTQPAGSMDRLDKLLDVRVENPSILRVGDEQGRRPLRNGCLERRQVRVAIRVRVNRDDLVPRHLGADRK